MEKLKFLLVLIAILVIPSVTLATTVDQIHEFEVSSNDMDGMVVDIVFGDATTFKTTWGAINSTQSGAGSTGWSITNTAYDIDNDGNIDNDTMFNTWSLFADTSTITSLTINGISAGIVFDIIYSSDTGKSTPDSMNGWWDGNYDGSADFTLNQSSGYLYSDVISSGPSSFFLKGSYYDDLANTNIKGQYFDWAFSDGIVVGGQSAIDPLDVWGVFTLNFDNPTTQEVETFSGTLNFDMDTDAATVPEPATMLLFGLGLLGITALGRKRT